MFTALAEMNYSGFLSVEFESFRYHQQVLRGDTVEAARRCMRDVRALLG
jgi:sugar phosphate isomerase/epimerase